MNGDIIIPLSNFNLEDLKIIDLGNAKIIPIECTAIFYKIKLEPKTKYILKIRTIEREEPRRTLDRVLIIFKLFKDSLVLSNVILDDYGNTIDLLLHYRHWVDQDRGLPEYVIYTHEEQSFIDFWNEFKEIEYSNFAVSRFHLADYSPYSRDRLVNYVESLEFLFVPDSSGGEISYKFRSRGTLILGRDKSPSERETIYKQLRDTYDLRSAIVHGNRDKEDKMLKNRTWEDYLQYLRCFTRESIKFYFRHKCLNNNKERQKLMERMMIFNCKLGD